MDEHFRTAPLAANLPATMALLTCWYRDLHGAQTHAVVPYAQALDKLPSYLQQLEMESNGKSVQLDGSPVEAPTGAIVWGTAGTNGQHAYFQLLHQGTTLVPIDFVGFVHAQPDHELGRHQDLLVANVLAQAEALAFGKTAAEVAADGVAPALVPHRTFPGNRPSSVLLADRLTPARARCARRRLRAQGADARHPLGHRLVRPVGRGAGQGARGADHHRARGRHRARARARRLHQRVDPALPVGPGFRFHLSSRFLLSLSDPSTLPGMGQPITVTMRAGTRPDVRFFEANRSITGMATEMYRSGDDVAGARPPDVLARRLLDLGASKVTVYSNIVTVEAPPSAWGALEAKASYTIEHLFEFYGDDAGWSFEARGMEAPASKVE